ncbi:hypothetical protein [Mesorhizobium sp. WSM4884]|uniref:hypothetical protein n=1 Tax=Mesorhizobium sp. WSM4884 TaxID=3038542 RepID=UPI002416184D|nr:hypothetical protein [Mesorhizobium sp. WSM4884]MDG4882440.1 hypothetical protein [Mesorhizobium sp. WSM4884]
MSPRLAYSRPQSDDARKAPYDYQQQRDIMRGIPRMMSPYLTAPQEKVLHHVFSQSVDMGREYLLTSYYRLEHGDPDAKTKGTGYSKRQLQRIVGDLEGGRFIAVKQTGRGLKITPNPNWTPGPDAQLPAEKRKQAAKKAADNRRENNPPKPMPVSTLWTHPHQRVDTDVHSRGDTDVHSEWTRMSTTKEELEKEEAKKEETYYRSPVGDREPVFSFSNSPSVSVRVRVRQRPALSSTPAKKETPRVPPAPPLTASALEKTYRAAFETAYGDQPGVFATAWTREQLGIINAAIVKKWDQRDPEGCHDYIEWVVMNFSRLRRLVFGWMKRPEAPVAPDCKFLARWHGDLLKAYQKRRQEQAIEGLDSHEERKLAHLTRVQGKSREEALIAIAEDRAALKLRDEIERGKAEIAVQRRAAEIAQKNAERTRDRAILHPRSDIARRIADLEARLAAAQETITSEPIDLVAAVAEGERRAREENPMEAKAH